MGYFYRSNELREELLKIGVDVPIGDIDLRLRNIMSSRTASDSQAYEITKNIFISQYKPEMILEKAKAEANKKSTSKPRLSIIPDHFYVINGFVNVTYNGRADKEYSGKAIVLIKPDNSIIIHSESGVEPKNYLNKSNEITLDFDGNYWVLKANNGKESLIIHFIVIELYKELFCPSWFGQIKSDNNDQKVYKVIIPEPAAANNILDKKLYVALKDLRMELLKELIIEKENDKIPAFTIYDDKTIYSIIDIKPKDTQDLMRVRGLGSHRIANYGNRILKVVSETIKE